MDKGSIRTQGITRIFQREGNNRLWHNLFSVWAYKQDHRKTAGNETFSLSDEFPLYDRVFPLSGNCGEQDR